MSLDLADFYGRVAARFGEGLAELPEPLRARAADYRVAPFASDPETTLRPGPLYVVSMKPRARRGGRYPYGWDERRERPGLHRWFDGEAARGNFVREATALLRGAMAREGIDGWAPREVFNTYATFWRAEDARQLRAFGLANVDCAAFHAELLAAVRPRLILAIGNGPAPSALATLRHAASGLGGDAEPLTVREVAPRIYVKTYRAAAAWLAPGERCRVVAVPHLSYVRAATLLAGWEADPAR